MLYKLICYLLAPPRTAARHIYKKLGFKMRRSGGWGAE
jgi:predicted GNAT family acetyltransferase